MSRSKYNLDFGELVRKRLPIRQRTPRHRAWVVVLLLGLQYVYDQLRYYIDGQLYFLNHSSQTCRLEGALNDTFDPTLRRLFITDGGWSHALFLWQPWEPRPQLTMYQPSEVTGGMPGVYLFQPAEVGPGSADFVVHIPLAIYWDTHRLGGLVNRYRLVCKGNWVEASF